MKRIECDICREPQIDRCEWHWEIKKKCFHTGDKRKIHICARCATAIIDVVMEKRKTYDAAPVCGEDRKSYTRKEIQNEQNDSQ